MYDILEDYRASNPVKQERKRMGKADWQLRDRSEKLSGSKMQMYMLLTTQNEIAAYCSLYADDNNKERHCYHKNQVVGKRAPHILILECSGEIGQPDKRGIRKPVPIEQRIING